MSLRFENQMIDMWGINTKDNLMFKYLVDQKKVDGPRLGRHTYVDDKYAAGVFSPWSSTFIGDSKGAKLHAPFLCAQDGAKTIGAAGWTFDKLNPLQQGRATSDMAAGMYATATPKRPGISGYSRSATTTL